MRYYADLHIHSKYARATSRDLDLEHLALWAKKKGIRVLGTGDFTHPAWFNEIETKLVPAEPGLFRLKPEIARAVAEQAGFSAELDTRFLLEVEISTIYKKGEKTRKVHHLIYAPDLQSAEHIRTRLARIGNISSDGRPILGLDSRNLLEIVLESGEYSYLVPAHIWTPWFSAMGSQSGFDSIEECYGDLSSHIFAVETGLSSDPPMNWLLSKLDRFRLISNSDAHSPSKLGREACVFDTELSYFAIREAFLTGAGYRGTVEFFPEEGKYHLDGHRKCNVRLEPAETDACGGICPVCGSRLTVGVLNRIRDLADRQEPLPPPTAADFRSFVPLAEILSEIQGKGPNSKAVQSEYERMLSKHGSELEILDAVPLEDLQRDSSSLLSLALSRMRKGQALRDAGYDGEYGKISLLTEDERNSWNQGRLFAVPQQKEAKVPTTPRTAAVPLQKNAEPENIAQLILNEKQTLAVAAGPGPKLIIAGPGTGKTSTLSRRLAFVIQQLRATPESCVAISFTRKAAREMSDRLEKIIGPAAARVFIGTFHAFGLSILLKHHHRFGLAESFRVLGPDEELVDDKSENRTAVTLDELVSLPVQLLGEDQDLRDEYRRQYAWVFVDEYQDIDPLQYELLRLLAPSDGNIFAIGDPDQAIYGFRGSDKEAFVKFAQDHPATETICLETNYRSRRQIIHSALEMIAAESLVPNRSLIAARGDGESILCHSVRNEREEVEYVIAQIETLIGGSSFYAFDSGRVTASPSAEYSFADFAILFRTTAQGAAFAEEFHKAGIPFQFSSHSRLAENAIVGELLEVMRSQSNSSAVLERLRTAERLLMLGRKQRQALTDDGGEKAHEAETDGSGSAIREIVTLLAPLARTCEKDFALFCAELTALREVDLLDPRADRVSLLTLHAAKGLEFPVVFIVGCEDGFLPHRFGSTDKNDPSEERRLFFVGMTRARERLILTTSGERFIYGSSRQRQRSPFLVNIPADCIEYTAGPAEKKKKRTAAQLAMW
jgi:uncharacterized protein (TIGR00375 family)